MMEVTKVMKKTSRRDSVLMSFDVFKDLYMCNLQLDPFNIFYHMFIRYIISGAQLYQFVQLKPRTSGARHISRQLRCQHGQDCQAPEGEIFDLGPMRAVFCDVLCLLKTLKNPTKHTRM